MSASAPPPWAGQAIRPGPLVFCANCNEPLGQTPIPCSRCGHIPGRECRKNRLLADRIDRAMKLRHRIVARGVSDGAGSQVLSEHDPARQDALRGALQVDCVSPATWHCRRTLLFLDIHGSEGRLTLGLDAEEGRVEVGDDGWALLLCDPRRLFRWLSERGMKGLSTFV